MNSLRVDAEILRDQGYSYAMIAEALGVAKGTMSYWLHDRPFIPNSEAIERIKRGRKRSSAIRRNKRLVDTKKTVSAAILEIGVLSPRDLWMLGIGLYVGEGAKTNEIVRICNSDPAVIKTVIRWLEEICGVSKSSIAITLHLYPDNNEAASIDYWQKVTGLPIKNFCKTSIDRRTNKSKSAARKLPHGTAHLRVRANGDKAKGAVLFRRVAGWMQVALNQV